MAKKKKSKEMSMKPLLFAGGGILIAYFVKQYVASVQANYLDGIGLKLKRFRVNFSDTTFKVPIVNINVPRFLDIYTEITVENSNVFSVEVNNINARLTYGQAGKEIVPVNSPGFNLPAKGKVETTLISQLDLLTKPFDIISIALDLKNNKIKKLWMDGVIRTNYVTVPISQQIELL